MMIQIQIRFKSFESLMLLKTFQVFKALVPFLILSKQPNKRLKCVQRPMHRLSFTVLRSPHIDKKSREQFEIRTYTQHLRLRLQSQNVLNSIVLELLQQTKWPGVELQIQMNHVTSLKKRDI